MPAPLRTSTYYDRSPTADIAAVEDVANIREWRKNLIDPKRNGTDVADQQEATSALTSPLLERPPVTVLAEWNGCVEHVGTHYFTAALRGLSGEGVQGQEEDAEIPLSDVGEADLELLAPGNFFRLSICLEVRADGQPRRYTQVVFRRLPAYRAHDLARADERALERHRGLRVE